MDEHQQRPPEVLAAAVDSANNLPDVAAIIAARAQARLRADAAVLTAGGDGRPEPPRRLAAAGPLVGSLDAVLDEHGPGPMAGELACGSSLTIGDTRDDDTWTTWSGAAARHGVRSVILIGLLPLAGSWIRLDLFSHRPHAFSSEDVARAEELAGMAGIALRLARRLGHLEQALQTRDVIGQGQGIVMERYGLDSDHALSFLRRTSQASQVRVRDLAQELVDGSPGAVAPGAEPEEGPA